jgi:hypothetical protein
MLTIRHVVVIHVELAQLGVPRNFGTSRGCTQPSRLTIYTPTQVAEPLDGTEREAGELKTGYLEERSPMTLDL